MNINISFSIGGVCVRLFQAGDVEILHRPWVRVMRIGPFLPNGVPFDPFTVRAMTIAFEVGWRVLQLAGLKSGREALAAKIIVAAANGEHDPRKLVMTALTELGVQRIGRGRFCVAAFTANRSPETTIRPN